MSLAGSAAALLDAARTAAMAQTFAETMLSKGLRNGGGCFEEIEGVGKCWLDNG